MVVLAVGRSESAQFAQRREGLPDGQRSGGGIDVHWRWGLLRLTRKEQSLAGLEVLFLKETRMIERIAGEQKMSQSLRKSQIEENELSGDHYWG